MITIITPSCRQKNLQRLYESIEFHIIEKWIIVYDTSKNRTYEKLFASNPKIIEVEHNESGKAGHAQRNYGTTLVEDGHIYFLDDDNIIHPDFWAVVAILEPTKFYTFDQRRNSKTILKGNNIRLSKIDTAMFIVHKKHTVGILWNKDMYNADGHFISEIYTKYTNDHIYIDQICCYYNYLSTSQESGRLVHYEDLQRNFLYSHTNKHNSIVRNLVSNPIANPANPIAKPIANHITKSIANHITKPISNNITKPIANHITKPIANHITKPIANHIAKLTKPLTNLAKPLTNLAKPLTNLAKPLTNLAKPLTKLTNPANPANPAKPANPTGNNRIPKYRLTQKGIISPPPNVSYPDISPCPFSRGYRHLETPCVNSIKHKAEI